jgi:polyisoprenoid-binding protein YceI
VRSAFGPAVLAAAALIAALVRWWLQGSRNVYTALDKRLYVADPDLGWRIGSDTPIWLGLEVCGILAAIAIGLAVAAWLVRRWERRRGREVTPLRLAGWIVAALTPAVPILAFMSGFGPTGARDRLPTGGATDVGAGIAGKLAEPPGRYEVLVHPGSAVTAQIAAGGEAFDARFAEEVHGRWEGDPGDLTRPMTAKVSVVAVAVDTGVGGRTKSARSYLQSEKFPTITFTLERVLAAKQDTPDRVTFRASGTLDFIGKALPIELTGTLARPDAAALTRLGLSGTVMLATADFAISIKETALVSDAKDFDTDRIPIHVSLVLRHTGG